MFKDVNQNFWQIASIQSAALGLQGMVIGEQLAKQYSIGVAISSLCLGNLILWIIGLSMFSMSYKGQGNAKHAIQNVLPYFGKPVTIVAALILMIAFISWFPVQIVTQGHFTSKILANYTAWTGTIKLISLIVFALIIIGVSTLGIRAIKWTCTIVFPLLLLYVLYALMNLPSGSFPPIEWEVSLHGTILATVIVFPGIINLPTFLRHSRSRADGILGLTLMTIFVIAFQAATIWLHFGSGKPEIFAPYSPNVGWTLDIVMLLSFVTLSTICVNLVNIYFASAALEAVVPSFTDARGYALIGLIGILALAILKSETLVDNIETVTNNFIGSLGIILLVGYLARTVVTHRHRHYEKSINVLCWVLGCVVSLWVFVTREDIAPSFISGILVSLFSFVIIIFIEETVWSIRQIRSNPK